MSVRIAIVVGDTVGESARAEHEHECDNGKRGERGKEHEQEHECESEDREHFQPQ